MKTLRFVILVIAILSGNDSFSQDRLALKLIFDKDEFLEAEPIPCGIELTNVSSVRLQVRQPANQVGCEFRLFDDMGNEIKYTGIGYFAQGGKLHPLRPGEQMFVIEEIEQLFGQHISLATAHKTLKKGQYTLQVSYWSGGQDSAVVETRFRIVEPIGQEKKAYETFMRIMWDARGGGDIKTPEELVRQLEEFETNFPTSVYTPIVLVELAAKYEIRLGQKEKAWEVGMRFVRRFPDAVAGTGYLTTVTDMLGTKEEKRTFVRELVQKAKTPLGKRYLRDFAKKRGLE